MDDRPPGNDRTTSSSMKNWARAMVPPPLWRRLRAVARASRDRRHERSSERLRRRMYALLPGARTRMRLGDFQITVNDGRLCYHLYKNVFVHRIYHFEAKRPDPLILDCGSNVGFSILYFKQVYPQSRVIGFEPDPVLLPYLRENMEQNGLTDVTIVPAAVARHGGTLDFYADGLIGSSLAEPAPGATSLPTTRVQVPAVRLRDYLTERVDFVKMNIEGAEWEVLEDSADRLEQVDCLAIEYHHLPGLPRTLHKILALLHDHGFEYAVSDFGIDSYGPARPPMSLDAGTRYFRHIYAQRI